MSPLDRLLDALSNDSRTALLLAGIFIVWMISTWKRKRRARKARHRLQ